MKNILNMHFSIAIIKYIFFLILYAISPIINETNPLIGKLTNCLLLQNGDLFITNSNGMHIYDTNLVTLKNSYHYNSLEINDQNFDKISKNTLISQFPNENGMIICLVNDIIYFFDCNGTYLFDDKLTSYDYSNSYMNLLTYKNDSGFYYYMITFIIKQTLHILYYKVKNNNNELIQEKKFKPFYFDYPKININGYGLGCEIMKYENDTKVLTCCFQTSHQSSNNFITIQSFIIENNFTIIGEDIYAKVPTSYSEIFIRSSISENGKNLLACYRESKNAAGYCFVYNIDNNEVIKNNPLIKECSDTYKKFKVSYFNEKKEYIFACSDYNSRFTVMKINDEFEIINRDNYSNFNYNPRDYLQFNTFIILFDQNIGNYEFIIDPKDYEENSNKYHKTTIFNINIDINSSHNGGTPPESFKESRSEIWLESSSEYFLKVKDYNRHITVNEYGWIFIDFLNKKNE